MNNLSIDFHVDADLSRLWGYEYYNGVGTLAKVLALILKCILVSAHVLIYHMSSQEIF